MAITHFEYPWKIIRSSGHPDPVPRSFHFKVGSGQRPITEARQSMTSTANDKQSIDPETRERFMEAGMLASILVPALAAALYYVRAWESQDWLRLIAVIVLSLFFPLLAYSFYFFRKERRKVELERIVSKLDLNTGDSAYVEMFTDIRTGRYFCLATGIAWPAHIIPALISGTLCWIQGQLEVSDSSASASGVQTRITAQTQIP